MLLIFKVHAATLLNYASAFPRGFHVYAGDTSAPHVKPLATKIEIQSRSVSALERAQQPNPSSHSDRGGTFPGKPTNITHLQLNSPDVIASKPQN